MKKIIIGLILPTLLLFSCSKVIEVDYNRLGMKEAITIQGYLSGDGVIAYVNKSLLLNNVSGDTYLNSPNVWLYQNGEPYAKLVEKEKSMYVLPDIITIDNNAEYNLVVEAEGFETATSNIDKVINKVTIDTVYSYFDSTNWIHHFFVEYNDHNVNKLNSYFIKAYLYKKDNPDECEMIVEKSNDEGYELAKRKYYADFHRSFDSAVVEISTYSKVLIDFDKSLNEYEVSYGDIEFETVYPVNSYIVNGYGFLAAREISTYVLVR